MGKKEEMSFFEKSTAHPYFRVAHPNAFTSGKLLKCSAGPPLSSSLIHIF